MGKFASILGILIIIAVIVLCIPLTVPKFLGMDSYSVISGSMEPAIPTGSLVYSKYQDPETIEAGDVIVFNDAVLAGETMGDIPVVSHRVVKNDEANQEFVTKGDANKQEDMAPIPYNNLIGKVIFHIPVLGRLDIVFATMSGKLAMIAAILGGLILNILGKKLDSM